MATDNANSVDASPFPKYNKAVGIMVVKDVTRLFADKVKVSSAIFTCQDDPLRTSFTMTVSFGTEEENNLQVTVTNTSRPVRLRPPFIVLHGYDEEMTPIFRRQATFTTELAEVGSNYLVRSFRLNYNKEVLRIICDVNYAHEVPEIVSTNDTTPPKHLQLLS